MGEQENLSLIKEVYAAFGRGDLPAILGVLTDDVEWIHPRGDQIPWGGQRRGSEEVTGFFVALGQTIDVERFEPQRFHADGDAVIVFGRERMRVKATGRSYEAAWAHEFIIRDGKIARFIEYTDTASIIDGLGEA
ncbi:MAG TPA: nuclear transport factor 2 family protein [Blastocatellia bacterium]|nr:nuclear transport factor 2 family protein [Blastocatellia bacterium]